MNKRVLSVFGIAAFFAGGSQLFASDLAPFTAASDDSSYIAAPATTGIGDSVFDEEDGGTFDATSVVADDLFTVSSGSQLFLNTLSITSTPAPLSSNVGLLTPEPASTAMLLIGAIGVGFGARRRKIRS